MENIFLKYPDFIQSDVRKDRYAMPNSGVYNISTEIQYLRHNLSLPENLIKGKSVLDLGCCVAAGGAWALSAGASKYVGVELQNKFYELSKNNLEKYFQNYNWKIYQLSFDEFFKSNTEKFDIIIAWGATYKVIRLDKMLENMCNICNDFISIESAGPFDLKQALKKQNVSDKIANWICENIAFTEWPRGAGTTTDDGKKIIVKGAFASLPAFEILFNSMGFYLEKNNTPELRKNFPDDFKFRVCAIFKKSQTKNDIPVENILTHEESYNCLDKIIKVPFGVYPKNHPLIKEWDFEKSFNDYPTSTDTTVDK